MRVHSRHSRIGAFVTLAFAGLFAVGLTGTALAHCAPGIVPQLHWGTLSLGLLDGSLLVELRSNGGPPLLLTTDEEVAGAYAWHSDGRVDGLGDVDVVPFYKTLTFVLPGMWLMIGSLAVALVTVFRNRLRSPLPNRETTDKAASA